MQATIELSKLYVENIGPVARGEVKISGLTVLTGPQGSGKSMIATLAYVLEKMTPAALLSSATRAVADGLRGPAPAAGYVAGPGQAASAAEVADKVEAYAGAELEERLPGALREHFAVSPQGLVRRGAKEGVIRAWFSLEGRALAELNVRLSGGNNHVGVSVKVDPGGVARLVELMRPAAAGAGGSPSVTFNTGLAPEPVFIPAERVAYARNLHSYLSLFLSSLAYAPLAGAANSWRPEDLTIPRHVVDYMVMMNAILGGSGEYELLGLGKVRVNRWSALFVGRDGSDVPMQLASAGVAELAGILMPIQYASRASAPPGLVVVEEPEAGLHPDVQLELVDALASTASNFRLVLTTHSDFVLAEISYLNMARRLRGLSAYYIDDDHVIKELNVSSAGEVELPKSIARALDSLSRRALSALANEGRSEPEVPA